MSEQVTSQKVDLVRSFSFSLSSLSLFHLHFTFMQTAVDALKSVMSTSNTSNSSSAPEQFQKGWTPNAEKGKEAQGGDDSRPPGKQHTMVGEFLQKSEE